MNEYSVKTALYREKTGKGTKFLTFLGFWYPLLRFPPNILSILYIVGFAAAPLSIQQTNLPAIFIEWFATTFVYTVLIVLFILTASELALGYFIPHLKPVGFYFGIACFSLRTVITFLVALVSPFLLLDALLCLLIVIYLIKRKSLYGIATKNQPAITLSPDVILHNSVFKCGVTWHLGGNVRFNDTHLVMEGDFLPSNTFSFPYEALRVQHDKMMLSWQFQNVDSKQQVQVKILPFHGNGLKKLLIQQGITPTVK